jgi:hypothetical protein
MNAPAMIASNTGKMFFIGIMRSHYANALGIALQGALRV